MKEFIENLFSILFIGDSMVFTVEDEKGRVHLEKYNPPFPVEFFRDFCNVCAIYKENFNEEIKKYLSESLGKDIVSCEGMKHVKIEKADRIMIHTSDIPLCKKYVGLENLKKKLNWKKL